METHTMTADSHILLNSQIRLQEEVAKLQKVLLRKRLEKKSEEVISLEGEIDHLQRLILASRH